MKTSPEGVALIKRLEGLRLNAYQCEAGRWTIGYGHTGDVREGMRITAHQADAILDVDLDRFERDVLFLTPGVSLKQHEFDALVSFCFNVGSDIDADKIPEGLGDSTLLAKLLRGDRAGAADEFPKWNKVGKVIEGRRVLVQSSGLTKRRLAERALFLSADKEAA